jgi:3-oxoacyl-[acyl-carrier protein] reductase
MAELFCKEGAKVVINDIDGDVAEETVQSLKASGAEAVACVTTVDTMEGGEALAKTALDNFGKIDCLVNNAGILRDRSFPKMTEDEWDSVMSVHAKGHFCCSKAVIQPMRGGGGGSIINVTSTTGLAGRFGQVNYAAAKAAILGFTRALAIELAKYDIRVNVVAPSALTRMTESIPGADLSLMPGPEMNSALFTWLASDASKELTGQVFHSGGEELSLWSHPDRIVVCYNSGGWTPQDIIDKFQPRLAGKDSRGYPQGI